MDPTTSPRSLKIPLPRPLDGLEIPIPTGPHAYSHRTWVGNVKLGATREAAFEALRRRATPFQNRVRVSDGDVTDIPGFGRVRHIVDAERFEIVNITMEGHRLHPGSVFRSIVQEGDDLYVVTRGHGTGKLPRANEKAAASVWGPVDEGIHQALNPPPPSTFEGFMPPERSPAADKPAADRTRDQQNLMGDRHSEYWRGPKADALQQEYRDLIAARGGDEPRDRSPSFDPERGRTIIGIDADKRVDGEDSTVLARMTELQGLMADRHSEYWRGPKADILQQEYRDLIELRNKNKLREDELSLFAAAV